MALTMKGNLESSAETETDNFIWDSNIWGFISRTAKLCSFHRCGEQLQFWRVDWYDLRIPLKEVVNGKFKRKCVDKGLRYTKLCLLHLFLTSLVRHKYIIISEMYSIL